MTKRRCAASSKRPKEVPTQLRLCARTNGVGTTAKSRWCAFLTQLHTADKGIAVPNTRSNANGRAQTRQILRPLCTRLRWPQSRTMTTHTPSRTKRHAAPPSRRSARRKCASEIVRAIRNAPRLQEDEAKERVAEGQTVRPAISIPLLARCSS